MGAVSDYLSTLAEADRSALERVYAVAREVVPEAAEGVSYGMAALLYRGKGLVATVRTKRFLSLYPFSGRVIAGLAEELREFEATSGSIHYSAEHPLPEALVRRLAAARRAEIDRALSARGG